jgi:hypothetical protein
VPLANGERSNDILIENAIAFAAVENPKTNHIAMVHIHCNISMALKQQAMNPTSKT